MTVNNAAQLRKWAIEALNDNGRQLPDQRSTADQMRDLERLAVMLKMYDAADVLRDRRRSKEGVPRG